MEERISIIISSKHTNEEKKDFIQQIQDTCENHADIMFIVNQGGMPLTRVYQEYMEKAPNDIIIFVHDDVEFLKKGWGREITRLFNEHPDYGIIGVAGTSEFHEEAAWWNFKKIYGQVLHRHEGKSWLTAFSPLLTQDLQEVCMIDGLFMAVHRKRISKPFNIELEGFNMYDVDFCLSNYIDGKTKIGVTTNIRLAHNSIGALNENWFINREKINEKFGEYYPIDVENGIKRKTE